SGFSPSACPCPARPARADLAAPDPAELDPAELGRWSGPSGRAGAGPARPAASDLARVATGHAAATAAPVPHLDLARRRHRIDRRLACSGPTPRQLLPIARPR